MGKFKKAVLWFLVNGAFAALTYLSIMRDMAWAGRIVTFWISIVAILYTFALANDEVHAKAKAAGRSVPAWMDVAFDLSLLTAFVAAGWWYTAIVQLWQMLVFGSIFGTDTAAEKAEKKKKELSDEEWQEFGKNFDGLFTEAAEKVKESKDAAERKNKS